MTAVNPDRETSAPSSTDAHLIDVTEHGDEAGRRRLVECISASGPGSEIAVVSITACSLLGESEVPGSPGHALFGALRRGSCVRLVVLDPDSAEARVRSAIESPGLAHESSVLSRDARQAHEHLAGVWQGFGSALRVRRSSIGLGFNLWLTPHAARVEPYHLGQDDDRRHDPEAPFQGLAHLWFGSGRAEYGRLDDHFAQLWRLAGQPAS